MVQSAPAGFQPHFIPADESAARNEFTWIDRRDRIGKTGRQIRDFKS
jgi:hypothetical protein